jgi:hypothetical protein
MADPLYDKDAQEESSPEPTIVEDKDRQLLNAIKQAEQTAYGSDGDSELNNSRARAIDDYLGKPYGNEIEGRSQVVSRDVHDTIEWIKPSLIRIFTSGDEVARFDPQNEEDEASGRAQQETDYINYIVQEKQSPSWVSLVYEWFTDALMTKNAYALGYWSTKRQVETERYANLSDDELALLAQDPNVEIMQHTPRPADIPPQPGLPPPMLHDVVIRRPREEKGVKICILPPERCLVSEDVSGMSVRCANFFQYWEEVTISSLREMGFNVADDIPDDSGNDDTEEDQARDIYSEQGGENDTDPAMRKVKLRTTWIKFDYDGDGVAEHRYTMTVGDTILYNDQCSGVPVAAIVPTPMPHRHPGLSVRDAIEDLQLIKTAIWRSTLDNFYLANNGRTAISDKVNLDDMLTSRPGGVVRVGQGGIPGNEIFPFQQPFVAAQALTVLDYIDKTRDARTGAGQAFTGVDPNALNEAHSGIALNQLASQAAQRVELIARVFAEGVKELFLIVHELIIKHGHQAEVVRLRNKWVTIDPSQWKKRQDMRISVGLGTGNKEQMMVSLQMIGQAQEKVLPLGLVKPHQIYNTLAELTKAAGFSSPQKFWTEPDENAEMPQPGPPIELQTAQIYSQTEIAKAQIKEQGDTERKRIELESKERIAAAEIAAKQEQTVLEGQVKQTLQQTDIMHDSQKHQDTMMLKREEKPQPVNLDTSGVVAVVEKRLEQFAQQQAQEMTQAVQAIVQQVDQMVRSSNNFDEVIVRDKSGRALGKKRVPAGTLKDLH